jgi:hypothetical protein
VVPTETVVAELDEEISTMPPLDPLLQLDADLKQAVAPKAKPSKKDKLLTPKNVAMAALAGTMIYLLTRRS